MDSVQKNEQFQAHLTALETSLMTPRVSGEMVNWVKNASTALEAVGAALEGQVREKHRATFKQITSEDSEMHRRVELLKADDQKNLEQFQNLRERANQLEKGAPRVEPDEGILDAELAKFSEDGLALVTELRKQEVAMETWLQEAFNRDRGISG